MSLLKRRKIGVGRFHRVPQVNNTRATQCIFLLIVLNVFICAFFPLSIPAPVEKFAFENILLGIFVFFLIRSHRLSRARRYYRLFPGRARPVFWFFNLKIFFFPV